MNILSKEPVVEKLIVQVLELILEARGFDGKLLLLPQRELRARDLLRDGCVPDEVVERQLASFDGAVFAIMSHVVLDLKDQRRAAVKRDAEAA